MQIISIETPEYIDPNFTIYVICMYILLVSSTAPAKGLEPSHFFAFKALCLSAQGSLQITFN